MIFGARTPYVHNFDISGSPKETRDEAKYLGVIFQRGGNWKCQQDATVTRCRMARGRCEIICKTLGIQKIEQIIQIYDMFVSSVYRYSIGAWGPTAGHLQRIDNIFLDFMRRQFRLPPRTSRNDLLAHFGRRCASCDAKFLAAVQLARGVINGGSIWNEVVKSVIPRGDIPWFRAVRKHLVDMSILDVVLSQPESFLSERKKWAVEFSRFCFHKHLNVLNGRSSDYFRIERPFGIYPVIYANCVYRTRCLLALLLSSWRWAYDLRDFPDYCVRCDSLVNSNHIMFNCYLTQQCRDRYLAQTGQHFTREALRSDNCDEAIPEACENIIRILLENCAST